MKNKTKSNLLCIMCILILPAILNASTQIIQQIQINPGWNAIFLKVKIQETDLNKIFENTPIKKVITFYPRHSSVQFIQDPDSMDWNKDSWLRWVSPDAPDAFLNNLYRLNANRAYLIYARERFTWNVQGKPIFERIKWQPESFNLTGFHIAPDANMTFADYFSGSKAHSDLNIYTLITNKWKRVANPYNELIQPNSAYWVFCNNGSDFNGGLQVIIPGINNRLEYQVHVNEITLTVKNNSSQDMSFSLSKLINNKIPLSIKTLNDNYEAIYEPFQQYSPNNSLKPGQSEKICLCIRRKEMQETELSGLLKIADDSGNQYYLTVWASGLN